MRDEGIDALARAGLAAAVAQADLVCCATTATQPVLRGAWLRPGTHLDLVGGFRRDMREVDDEAIARASPIVVDTRAGALAIFAFVLLVLEMLWGRASLIVFAVSFDGMPDFKGSILALFNPENIGFIVAYLVVGGVFAGLIFAVSVVAMPMMLDRPVDAITAGLTSLRLVLSQPGVMVVWGALITLLVVIAMLPWFAGLLIVGPVLGHASWHAYRSAMN